MKAAVPTEAVAERQLAVVVGGQSYTLRADSILEVGLRPRLTRVPHGPPSLSGLSNLRGAVLPVISLARLLEREPGSEERLVVFDHLGKVGLLVDAVLRLEREAHPSSHPQIDVADLLGAGFNRQESHTASGQQHLAAFHDLSRIAAHRVLLSFLVSGQTFALPLAAIIEVLRLPAEINLVAGTDAAILGVANVRDHALPIISLAALLGFPVLENAPDAGRILVVEYEGARIGLMADAIESILRLDEAAIEAVPPILQRGRGQAALDAIGRQGAGRPLVSILSVPRLFANAAIEATASTGAATMAEQDDNQAREQFVIFALGNERYGLPIAAVQEVLRLPDYVTRLPNGPRFVSGIINLRGRPVPLIDQRQRFDISLTTPAVRPRVIVVTVGGLQAGFVVDAVSEILSVSADRLAVTPPLSTAGSAAFSRVVNPEEDGQMILLIDPQQMLSQAEQDVIADIALRQNPAGAA